MVGVYVQERKQDFSAAGALASAIWLDGYEDFIYLRKQLRVRGP
jgi:hypothetical protein